MSLHRSLVWLCVGVLVNSTCSVRCVFSERCKEGILGSKKLDLYTEETKILIVLTC